MPQNRHSARSITMNGKCYIIGGQNERSISVYDPKEDSFTFLINMDTARMNFGCCKYSYHEILIAGGDTESKAASDSCIVYDTWTNKVKKTTKFEFWKNVVCSGRMWRKVLCDGRR